MGRSGKADPRVVAHASLGAQRKDLPLSLSLPDDNDEGGSHARGRERRGGKGNNEGCGGVWGETCPVRWRHLTKTGVDTWQGRLHYHTFALLRPGVVLLVWSVDQRVSLLVFLNEFTHRSYALG